MHRLIVIVVAAVVTLFAAETRADVLSGYVQAQSGGASGVGIAGDLRDDAFHANAEGLTYGGLAGVEILFIDVWVEHNQYVRGSNFSGTWTQFMTGLDITLDLGATKGGEALRNGRIKGGYSQYFAEFGSGVGFGVGTGQQVDPPLDNAQVSDKGFLFQAQFGLGMRLNRMLSLGVSLPVQVAYMFKNDSPANDLGTNYGSMQAALIVNARFKWQIK